MLDNHTQPCHGTNTDLFHKWLLDWLNDTGLEWQQHWEFNNRSLLREPKPLGDHFSIGTRPGQSALVRICGTLSIEIHYRQVIAHRVDVDIQLHDENGRGMFEDLIAAIGETWPVEQTTKTQGPETSTAKRHGPGRRPLAAYDAAFERIQSGEQPADVEDDYIKQWYEELGNSPDADVEFSQRHSFRQAMYSRRKSLTDKSGN